MRDKVANVREKKFFLKGGEFYIRALRESDVSMKYCDWLNNPEVNKYLESRFERHSLQSIIAYIQEVNSSEGGVIFGVFLGAGDHIGNIKIGGIHAFHLTANIGLCIGDINYWGQGIATALIKCIAEVAKNELGLRKLIAGAYSNNLGSIKAFLSNGWVQEGNVKNFCRFNKGFVDKVILGRLL
jgi:[ribosomal protein S5]-alanine N-acetyltransferase